MRTQARIEADKRYKQKIKQIQIKYSIHEMEEYKKIEAHCKQIGTTYQQYVKHLIREDMKHW